MSISIPLPTPIEAHGEMITELVLREPTVEDLMVMDTAKGGVEREIKLISILAGVPPSTLKKLPGRFWCTQVEPVISDFLGTGQKTGED